AAAGHPPGACVVTESPTVPLAPAVNAMVRVPAPDVIVPFEIIHAYVAAAPASVADAEPAAPAQTADGAVIAEAGGARTPTLAVVLAEHPPGTVTVSETDADGTWVDV